MTTLVKKRVSPGELLERPSFPLALAAVGLFIVIDVASTAVTLLLL